MDPKHVLVADDESHIRLILSLILRKAGFKVTTVKDGLAALNQTLREKSRAWCFDLLVLDVQMPGLTGLELIEEIEALNLHVPILLISGYSDREMVDTLAGKGCIAYAQKPFTPDEFLRHVQGVLDEFNEQNSQDGIRTGARKQKDLPHAQGGRHH